MVHVLAHTRYCRRHRRAIAVWNSLQLHVSEIKNVGICSDN